MSNIPNNIRQALSAAGWHEGRHIDPAAYIAELREMEMVPHGVAIAFYSEFGELTIPYTSNGHKHVLALTMDSFRAVLSSAMRAVQERAGALCQIGHASHSELDLLMAPDGTVIGVYDGGGPEAVSIMGESGVAAIQLLVEGRASTPAPYQADVRRQMDQYWSEKT